MNSEIDTTRSLTLKQERFVVEFLTDLNGSQAAIRAGYSKNCSRVTAARLLTHMNVKAAIQVRMVERSERLKIDADLVIRNLIEIYERCMVPTPIQDAKGEPTGQFRFNATGAFRAMELIGKHLRMFVDRVEVSDFDPVQVVQEAADRVRKAREQLEKEKVH